MLVKRVVSYSCSRLGYGEFVIRLKFLKKCNLLRYLMILLIGVLSENLWENVFLRLKELALIVR